MLLIHSLNHIARETHRPRELSQFYREIGFRPVRRPDLGFDGEWLALPHIGEETADAEGLEYPPIGSILLHLIAAPEDEAEHPSAPEHPSANANASTNSPVDPDRIARGHHMAFHTDHFDECKKQLEEKGIQLYEQMGHGAWKGESEGSDRGKQGAGKWEKTRQLFCK